MVHLEGNNRRSLPPLGHGGIRRYPVLNSVLIGWESLGLKRENRCLLSSTMASSSPEKRIHTNGASVTPKPTMKSFPPGIHAPSVTFFKDDERQEVDWATQERHLEFLITSGVHGGMFFLPFFWMCSADNCTTSCARRLKRRIGNPHLGREEPYGQADSGDRPG